MPLVNAHLLAFLTEKVVRPWRGAKQVELGAPPSIRSSAIA
jgi:hypothetical protein